MYFDLDDDQRSLAAAAASFLSGADTLAHARALLDDPDATGGPDRAAWASSGFATITIPEASGGGGGALLDLAVVAEQAGRVLAAPSLTTWAMAAELLAEAPEHLARLAEGTLAVAVHDGGPVLDAVGAERFLTRDGSDLPLAAAAVKAASATTLEQAAETLVQVHGGIGFTWEHDAHLFWRRSKVDRLLLGDEAAALATVAELALPTP